MCRNYTMSTSLATTLCISNIKLTIKKVLRMPYLSMLKRNRILFPILKMNSKESVIKVNKETSKKSSWITFKRRLCKIMR
jgi:hypothetical protein